MKFKGFLFLCLFCLSLQARSQYYFYNDRYYDNNLVIELGGSIGAMNSLTDIGGTKGKGQSGVKDFTIKNTNLSGSFFINALYKYSVGIRLEATLGQAKGDDATLKSVAKTTNGRYERNLSFRTPISEIILATEIYPFIIFSNPEKENPPSPLQPYILGGIGYFHFNPQAKLNNNWVDLHPLHTEGQGFSQYPDRKVYQLNQVNFPVGLGIKYEASPLLNLRLEFAWRILKTDYLDDVSTRYIDPKYFPGYLSGTQLTQAILLNDRHLPGAETAHPDGIRGDPANNDSYFNLNFKASISINRKRI
jgi:hypothetical protein